MTPSERKELEACLKRASEILYNNAAPDSIETLEDIEIAVREQVLANVSPQIARLGARSLAPDGDAGSHRFFY